VLSGRGRFEKERVFWKRGGTREKKKASPAIWVERRSRPRLCEHMAQERKREGRGVKERRKYRLHSQEGEEGKRGRAKKENSYRVET